MRARRPPRTLLVLAPYLAKQWHPSKNRDLTPGLITVGADVKVWWQCPANPRHQWKARPQQRIVRPECPVCSPELFSRGKTVADVAPQLIPEWHPLKNVSRTPDTVLARSHRRVWWKCLAGPDHEWDTMVRDRAVDGASCPFCTGHRLSVTNSLAARFPDLAADWHPTKNGHLGPTAVSPGSQRKAWWRCRVNAVHEWEATVSHRRRNFLGGRGHGCPYCSHHRVVPSTSLSVLRPDLAGQWHPTKNGRLTPDDVTARSTQLVWWKCDVGPDHEWQMKPDQRAHGRSAHCPFCANRRLSVTNSIAARAPALAQDWHPSLNGKVTPAQVIATVQKQKFWWRCSRGHAWESNVYNRFVLGRGCPHCKLRSPPVATTYKKRRRVLLPADFE